MRNHGTFNFPMHSSAPLVGLEAAAYYSSLDNKVYVSDGAAWNPLNSTPSSFGEYIFADETMPDEASDCRTAIQALIDGAPSSGSGQVRTVVFTDRVYLISSPGLVINGKAINFLGVRGSIGTSAVTGTRFIASNASMTILKIGDISSSIFQHGPMIEGILFYSNTNTGVTGVWLENVNHTSWNHVNFTGLDFAVKVSGAISVSSKDNAWHIWNDVRIWNVGLYGPASGGCAGFLLLDSYGMMVTNYVIDVKPPSTSGFNYGIYAPAPGVDGMPAAPNTGAYSHKFLNGFIDGSSGNPRTIGICLRGAKFTMISHGKLEACAKGLVMGGGNPTSSWGRGNVVDHFSVSGWNLVGVEIEAGAGDSGTDGGGIDHIGFEFGTGSKLTNAAGAGFKVGTLYNN